MKNRILIIAVLVAIGAIAGGVYYYGTLLISAQRYLDSSKVCLIDSHLNYGVLDQNITIPTKGRSANVGDQIVIITGKIRNDYDREYYFAITGDLYTSKGERLRGPDYILDGPIGEFTVTYAPANDFGIFELHFKYEKQDIEKYILCLAMEPQEIPPP